jgi:hypothetical protein
MLLIKVCVETIWIFSLSLTYRRVCRISRRSRAFPFLIVYFGSLLFVRVLVDGQEQQDAALRELPYAGHYPG